MPTFDQLGTLDDSHFHALCDDLFRRVEPRYQRLRTHGLNEDGVSIRGQPDAYVGETAETCSIAFQYSVDRDDWWNKIIADVEEAVRASPGVQEVVVATPRDIDREGPKRTRRQGDWLAEARAAAGTAILTPPFDGRDIARFLDTDHQDLRHKYLGIAYSTLTTESIRASCTFVSNATIQAIRASGRYDQARYVGRSADRTLFTLWQEAFRRPSSHEPRARLLALVNDSGIGKTSLLATFAQSRGPLSVLFLQARDIVFAAPESLVTHVIHALQGVLAPSARLEEERAIAHHLNRQTPLTVIVDGLDETRCPNLVQKAVTFWLNSSLGKASVLIVSSRSEFWKACVDRSWALWMTGGRQRDRVPIGDQSPLEEGHVTDGIRLPDRFAEQELVTAWRAAGLSLDRLYALPPDTRDELRHPFTLRTYADLPDLQDAPKRLTRYELLEMWLNHRLRITANRSERVSLDTFHAALRAIASRLGAGAGCVSVDDLIDVPRFTPGNPPGPVVEHLLGASILESVPDDPSLIRFVHEAVRDYYRAEIDLESLSVNPKAVATQFSRSRFTIAYPRLSRLGKLLASRADKCGEQWLTFLESLTAANCSMAAVVLMASPMSYPQQIRQDIIDGVASNISSRFSVHAAFAITLLGEINCSESQIALLDRVRLPDTPSRVLNHVAALSFARLGCERGALTTYSLHWLGMTSGHDAYYFPEVLSLLRATTEAFKNALSELALAALVAPSGHPSHARAVCVLAHVRDNRLASHLNDRLAENDSLLPYENHGLIALGTAEAAAVYVRSAVTTGFNVSELPYGERYRLQWGMCPRTADLKYIITAEFGPCIIELVSHPQKEVQTFGYELVMSGRDSDLLGRTIAAGSRHYLPVRERTREWIPPEAWVVWWNGAQGRKEMQQSLLESLPSIPSAEIEDILVDCLQSRDLRAVAALALGNYGCYRARTDIRRLLLFTPSSSEEYWAVHSACVALGTLRDEQAVSLLSACVAHGGMIRLSACGSLGLIGTTEAEEALKSLYTPGDPEAADIAGGLLLCGSTSGVALAVSWAACRPDGFAWLKAGITHLLWMRGHVVGEYYTHINTLPLTSP